ncbi:MAG: hypothetical protein ACPGO3_11295 [Magnetospiraceae bacterium]
MSISDSPFSDASIVSSAEDLVKKHGKDAIVIATMRAEESLSSGDMDGYRTWKRLMFIVDSMDFAEPDASASFH